jgi:nitroimidazol reductase NimA-like FMN-containing flavoprotein (pyridoxamine 5'-phosphate oxidase superfamily)
MRPAQPGQIDTRFSQEEASSTAWEDVEAALEQAQLYWITTVRADGRPHVTPLIGVLHDGAMHISTGEREQKFRNLEGNPRVALTTGRNEWAGLDVVVEGSAERITGRERLEALAEAVEAKYGDAWRGEVHGDEGFEDPAGIAAVFRIAADKVIAFAKDPFAQTTFRMRSDAT